MEQIFLQAAQTQGFSVVLLLIITWILYKRQLLSEQKIDALQNERRAENEKFIALITELKAMVAESQSVIKENSDLIQKIGDFMEDNLVVAKKKTS